MRLTTLSVVFVAVFLMSISNVMAAGVKCATNVYEPTPELYNLIASGGYKDPANPEAAPTYYVGDLTTLYAVKFDNVQKIETPLTNLPISIECTENGEIVSAEIRYTDVDGIALFTPQRAGLCTFKAKPLSIYPVLRIYDNQVGTRAASLAVTSGPVDAEPKTEAVEAAPPAAEVPKDALAIKQNPQLNAILVMILQALLSQ